jgi:hypothetical protein
MIDGKLETIRNDYDRIAVEYVVHIFHELEGKRGPYAPEVEHQSQRAYIFARKPNLTPA